MPENEKVAAAFLASYQCIMAEIQRLQKEIGMWRGLAEELKPIFSEDPSMEPIEQIDALCEWLASKIRDQAKRLILIKQIISAVEDDHLRRLLWYRYIDGTTYEAIAAKMDFTTRHIARLHKKALAQIMIDGADGKRGIA